MKTMLLLIFAILTVGCTGHVTPIERLVVGTLRGSFLTSHVYVAALDQRQVIEPNLPDNLGSQAEWSKDGLWIAFSKSYQGKTEDSEIYLLRSGSGEPQQITETSWGSYEPSWSPDGKSLAHYSSDAPGVMIVDVQCYQEQKNCESEPVLVAKDGYSPSWSPDGTRLVFEREGSIYSIAVSGKGAETPLVEAMSSCRHPKWSPDGERIVFSCFTGEHHDIFTVQSDGSDLVNLTGGFGSNTRPSWTLDGSRIAFISTHRDGLGELIGWSDTVRSNAIYTMDANGENIRRVTIQNDEHVLWFSWLPSR